MVGDKLVCEPAIILANHASLLDHVLMTHLASRETPNQREKPRVSFFTWFSLWSLPSSRTIRNMAKVDENWELSASAADQIFGSILISPVHDWIVLFPEVNIWSEEAKDRQNRLGNRYFLPSLRHLLYPRVQSVASVSAALNGKYKVWRLYDVTIGYFQRDEDHNLTLVRPSLFDLVLSREETLVIIHVKERPIKKIQCKRSKLERWLEKVWVEKDSIIQFTLDNPSLQDKVDGKTAND